MAWECRLKDEAGSSSHRTGETNMRKIIIASIIAVTAATSFAAPSLASDCNDGYSNAGYYGHRQYARYEQPHCFTRKVVSYDDYGYRIVRRVRVCN